MTSHPTSDPRGNAVSIEEIMGREEANDLETIVNLALDNPHVGETLHSVADNADVYAFLMDQLGMK